jgi:eukaryotic-like serine/threonine-protein kinase
MRRRAVDRLLVEYLELPDVDQPDFLKRCRQHYPRLSRWLDEMTNGGHTVTLLDESVRKLASTSVERMEVSAARLAEGDRLGPWQVIEEVGQGGMGRVYRGRRADGAFEMDVAIKQIGQRRRGLAELLQRECRLLARLDHSAVTRLVDAGLDDRAGPFLVMEWIEGTDLGDWLAREQPDLETRLKLFEYIAEAVAHAHQRLIVHGDIKPNNIRIRNDGSIKLMDFGVARLLNSGEVDQTDLRALTPAFAAPEQLAGEDITPASDIWSLGTLLHWLLTGQSLRDNNPNESSRLKANSRLRNRELAGIIDRARAELPQDRYRSIDELLADLARLRSHQPVSVLPATPAYRFDRFVRRNLTLVSGFGATFLALSTGLAMVAWMYSQAEQARQAAELAREQAEANARSTEQVADFQAEQISQIDIPALALDLRQQLMEAGFSPPPEDTQLELNRVLIELIDDHLLATTAEAAKRLFDEQPMIQARLLQSLASSQREFGLFERARESLNIAGELIRDHGVPDHPVALANLNQQYLLHAKEGNLDKAMLFAEEALAGRERVLGPDHPDTLISQRNLARHFQRLGRIDEAQSLYRQVFEDRKRVLGEQHPDTLLSVVDLGTIHILRNELDEGEQWLLDAVEGFTRVLGENNQRTTLAMNNLAVLYRRQGNHEKARDLYAKTLGINQSLLGDRHPATLQSFSNLGVVYQSSGDYERAAELFNKTLMGFRELFGDLHPETLAAASSLGAVQHVLGDNENAGMHLTQAVAGREQVLGRDHPGTVQSMSNLVRHLIRQGKAADALEMADFIYQNRLKRMGDASLATLLARNMYGTVLRESGSISEAYEVHQHTLTRAIDILPEEHPRLSNFKGQLALTLRAMNRNSEAITMLEGAYTLALGVLGEDHPYVQELSADLVAWKE